MYTAEEVRKIEFTRSVSGYKTGEVDAFIDQCADTLEALARRNDEQVRKLEVLAERLMEYRKDEENIHTALLSAQRAGDTLMREAQHKAELIIEDATIKAGKMRETAERDIQKEKEELARIRNEVSTFKEALLDMYRQHLTLIDALPADPAEKKEPEAPAEPVAEPPVVEKAEPKTIAIEEAVEESKAEELPLTDIFSSSAMAVGEVPEEISDAPEEDGVMTAPNDGTQAMFFNEVLTEDEDRPVSRFKDLQFGPDYEMDGDSRRRFGRRK